MKRIITVLSILFSSFLSAAPKPNVIYILADDLGYGDLSCYGQKKFETPNIDALAKKGMMFRKHYSGAPVCAPARGALLTGYHVGHGAVRGNSELPPEGQQAMPATTFTLAHMFQKAGYATACMGKWGLGAPDSTSEPLKMGFQHFYGYNCQRLAHHYYPYFLWNDNQREMLWGNFGTETGDFAPDLIQAKALQFIQKNQKNPFFLYYAMIQPHADMTAPEKNMAKYRGKFSPEKPFKGVDDGPLYRKKDYCSQPEPHTAFAAMIETLDQDVGELMEKLQELGIADNTIVIFSSDNGPHQEGGHNPDYFQSNGGLRGYKRDLYEGGIRIPMIAAWPGKIPASTSSDHVSAFQDILPTMAEIIGVTPPSGIDGISLAPTLLQKGKQPLHEYLYWEFHEKGGRVAIRKGNWKGVRYHVAKNPKSPLELYDLEQDPSESNNIAKAHPDVVKELDNLIASSRTTSPIEKFNFPVTHEEDSKKQ